MQHFTTSTRGLTITRLDRLETCWYKEGDADFIQEAQAAAYKFAESKNANKCRIEGDTDADPILFEDVRDAVPTANRPARVSSYESANPDREDFQ